MWTNATLKRLLKQRFLGLHSATCMLGELGRFHLAVDQRFQHRSCRLAQDVAGDAGELDVRAFQRLLDPIRHLRPPVDQGGAVASQFAQLSLATVGHETAPDQTVPQQVGDPFTVLDVGFAARHSLDVLGIGQDQLETVLQ